MHQDVEGPAYRLSKRAKRQIAKLPWSLQEKARRHADGHRRVTVYRKGNEWRIGMQSMYSDCDCHRPGCREQFILGEDPPRKEPTYEETE